MAFKMKGFTAFTKDKETKKDRLTKSMKLQEGEDRHTFVPEGKQPMSELIGDVEDRIEFLNEDVSSGRKTKKEIAPAMRDLIKRRDYLRQNI
jgi:hypothetical protein